MSLNLDPNVGISKWELRNWMTALTNGYPITPDIRRAMIGKAVAVLATSTNERTTARVIDVLCKMDSLNVKREALEACAVPGERRARPTTGRGGRGARKKSRKAAHPHRRH